MIRASRGLAAAAALVLAALAGCGRPQATVRYMAGGPDEAVTYDAAVFQLARGNRVQFFLFRRTAAPVGEADPDHEIVLLELPERSTYGWVKDDNVPAYRWVRRQGRDLVWRGTSGQARMRAADAKQHMHLDFQATLEPLERTPGGAYVLQGGLRFSEDIVLAQGLMNRYGQWLLGLVGKKPPEPPPAPAKPPAPSAPGRAAGR
ncbi:MAG: hypothetical protein FJ288_04005 [Planctomycetes bacterium]|nr:hypothetical protein [Planctomycetota bacterium]